VWLVLLAFPRSFPTLFAVGQVETAANRAQCELPPVKSEWQTGSEPEARTWEGQAGTGMVEKGRRVDGWLGEGYELGKAERSAATERAFEQTPSAPGFPLAECARMTFHLSRYEISRS